MKKVVLIDGNSILTRAFYGIPMLSTADGLHTNAVYGFLNIMFRILDEEKPDGLVVAFDMKDPTFRHKKYPEYKGTRSGLPQEFHEQVPMIKDVLTAMNIPIISISGYEADDIIGTLAEELKNENYEVIVVSGDRDLLQLSDNNVRICIPKTSKGQTIYYNYLPDDVIREYGVTPKEFIDVKALMGDTSDNIPGLPGVGEKTAVSIIQKYHNIETAHANADEVKPPRASLALKENYDKAELSKWLATIDVHAPVDIDEADIQISDIYNQDAYKICYDYNLKSILKRFPQAGAMSEIINVEENSFFEEDGVIYSGNLKEYLKTNQLSSDKKYYDIGIAEYLLNPLAKPNNSFTLNKAKEYLKKIDSEGMKDLYDNIEMPLVYCLDDMEKAGIKIDAVSLKQFADELKLNIEKLEQQIYDEAGEIFNINSPKQLGVILFEKLGLPSGKKTKTGYSTSADVLEKLSADYEIVRHILEYRTLTKLYSTYAIGLAEYIADDGRIHGTFNQTVTATGRISSTEPNLQNIPIRTELGSKIRDVFVPENGYLFVDADYSQIELRVLAAMSGDEGLIAAYKEGHDIHAITASKVFNVSLENVTPQMRRNAKAVNFGVVYGISAFGLSEGLSISRKEAQQYIDDYFKTYPKVKAFLDDQIAFAKANGFVKTLYGRKRPVPELLSANFMQRQFGERIAMNSPIQGTAADIMKIAMIRVCNRLKNEKLDARVVLQIHDELLIEARENIAEDVKKIVCDEMTNAADLGIILEVDAHIGKTWLEAK